MFNSFTGRLTGKGPDLVYLSTGGIEWEILTSGHTLGKLPPLGSRIRIYLYLHHKEDQLKLFGFYKADERALFLELIRVEGVGPKLALKILSGITSEAFIKALDTDDISTLTAVPGLGKKTASKIVLSLKGKILIPAEGEPSAYQDVIEALINMGFEKTAAKKAVSHVLKSTPPESSQTQAKKEENILRKALQFLSNS